MLINISACLQSPFTLGKREGTGGRGEGWVRTTVETKLVQMKNVTDDFVEQKYREKSLKMLPITTKHIGNSIQTLLFSIKK